MTVLEKRDKQHPVIINMDFEFSHFGAILLLSFNEAFRNTKKIK